MDAVIAVALLVGLFGFGYWIGVMRTKLQYTETMDMKKYQKLKKALDESVQKAQLFHQQNTN